MATLLASALLASVTTGRGFSEVILEEAKWTLTSAAPSPVASESCAALIERYSAPKLPSTGPPRQMPEELVAGFTMDGSIELGEFFVDDTMGGQGSHYKYPRRDIDHMIKGAAAALGSTRGGRKNDHWIADALKANRDIIKGGDVLIYGSMEPWYEAMMIAMEAKSVTTVEYNELTYDHPGITTATPQELPAIVEAKGGFDVALSISSFDHDGLGRYGDPLEPNNDLRAMRTARCFLKDTGVLVATVPIGPDVVVWNLHRRYGERRLPWMLDDWMVEHVVGWKGDDMLTKVANWRQSYEPVFVPTPVHVLTHVLVHTSLPGEIFSSGAGSKNVFATLGGAGALTEKHEGKRRGVKQ